MKHYLPIFLSAACLLLGGCIKDDLSHCDNVSIYFQYKADGEEDVLHQYMDRVDLYVFDETNHIMGVGHYTHSQLASFSAMPSFRLPEGRYKVVAVGNAGDNTQVVNVQATDFNDIYIQHPNWGTERHQGMRAGEMPYALRFENANAQTTFNNEINEAEKGTCHPALVYDEERGCYRTDDLALFRMDTDGELDADLCAHVLVLTDTRTGEELVRGNVYDYLQRNAERIDVTLQEALLPIKIQFSSIGVTVEVPEWVVEDVKPEF